MDDTRAPNPTNELLSHAGRLHAIARRLVGDGHAAEDLVQDTWVAALEVDVARLSRLRDSDGWRAWLAGATRNLSLRRLRRESARRAIEREVARPEAAGQLEHLAERVQQQRELSEAILELDEPYRSALVMRYLDGLEHEEIAARQRVSTANARKRVSRALSILRARLDSDGAESKGVWAGLLGFFGAGKSMGTESALSTPLALSPAGVGGVLVGIKAWIGVALVVGVGAALVATWLQESPNNPTEPPLARENTALAESALESYEETRDQPNLDSRVRDERRALATMSPQVVRDVDVWIGVVTNSAGQPLEGVLIRLCDSAEDSIFQRNQDPKVHSAPDGSFTVNRTKQATHLSFEAPTYLTQVVSPSATEPMTVQLLACPRVRGTAFGPSGAPARPPGNVTLTVRQQDSANTTQHAAAIQDDGSFLFDDLPIGRIQQVVARAKGFAPLQEARDNVLEAETTIRIDVELPKGLTVVGVVRDAETKLPIPHARVWSKDFKYDEANIKPSVIADAQGRYRLEGVEPEEREYGEQVLYLLWIVGDSEDYSPHPYDPYLARADAEGVCERNLDLAPRSCSLHVVLFEAGGEDVAQGVVVWFVDAEGNFGMQTSNRRGEISFEKLPAGNLGFVAYHDGRGDDGLYSTLTFERDVLAGSHERLELELRADRGTHIEGQVLDPEGAPVANVEVVARFDLRINGIAIPLVSESQFTDPEGRYRFEDMRAGHYRIDLANCSHPRDQHLDITAGEQRAGVVFVQGECMTIAGTVELAGAKLDRFYLKLIEPRTGKEIQTRRAGTDGGFQFDAVLEGTYDLLLMERDEEVDRFLVRPEQHSGIVLRVH